MHSLSSSVLKNAAPSTETKIYPRYAVDIGNRHLKFMPMNGTPQIIPSVILEIDEFQEIQGDAHSIVLEQHGQSYVIGAIAAALKGTAVYSDDKIKLAPNLVLAALDPGEASTLLIETLVLTVPDSRRAQSLKTALMGEKSYKRQGQPLTIQINTVEVWDESYPAWRYAVKHGLLPYPSHLTGILNLGGGTGIGRIFTPEGVLDRSSELVLPGTMQLASYIGAALQPRLDFSPNLSLIMDAIAQGSFLYGNTGISFFGLFEKYRDRWLTEIRQQLKAKWARQSTDIGQILVIGGSASLAKALDGHSRYSVVTRDSDPLFAQLIELYGMAEG